MCINMRNYAPFCARPQKSYQEVPDHHVTVSGGLIAYVRAFDPWQRMIGAES